MRRGFLALASGNLIGKLIGVLRELVIAVLFGATAPVTAFRIANTATFVPINFFAADALSVGFLPNHGRMRGNPDQAAMFYIATERLLIGFGLLISGVLIGARQWWVTVIAPGLAPGQLDLAAAMLFTMAVSVPFYMQANVASYLEISHGKYSLASTRPTLQSIGLISGTVAAFVLHQPLLLGWGFTGAYMVMSVWAAVRIRRAGYLATSRPMTFGDYAQALRVLYRTIAPILWVPIFLQGGWVAERAITSILGAPEVASLDYARLITDTANVLVTAPLGFMILSKLAGVTAEQTREVVESLSTRVVLFCAPLSGALLLVASPVVALVFQHGAFNAEAARITVGFLAGLSFGIWIQIVANVNVRALNVRRRNMEAAIGVAIGSVVMAGTDLALVRALGPFGIGFGASCGMLAQLLWASWRLGSFASLARDSARFGWPFAFAVVAWILIPETAFLPLVLAAVAFVGLSIGNIVVTPNGRRLLMATARTRRTDAATPS